MREAGEIYKYMKKIIKPKQQSKLHFDMIVTKTDNKLRDAQVVLN